MSLPITKNRLCPRLFIGFKQHAVSYRYGLRELLLYLLFQVRRIDMYEVRVVDQDRNLPYKYKSKLVAFMDAAYMSSQGYPCEVLHAKLKTVIRSYGI